MNWDQAQAEKDIAIAKLKLKDELEKLNGEWVLIDTKQKKILIHDPNRRVVMDFLRNHSDKGPRMYVERVGQPTIITACV